MRVLRPSHLLVNSLSLSSKFQQNNRLPFSLINKMDSSSSSTVTSDIGSLLPCQRDSYLRHSINTVLACDPLPSTTENKFKLILQNSVLYPEGGGQPFDLGTINGLPVTKVLKPDRTSEFAHTSNLVEVEIEGGSFAVGSEVRCEVDWNRRYEFMQQHTAQHLFSAVADLLFKAETVGWSMGTDSATVDLASNPQLTSHQLQLIEDEVNDRIRRGSTVTWKIFSRNELENSEAHPELQHLRGEVKGAALQMEELRLVSIADLDVNPCGGTHLNSLAEINVFKIIGFEKDRGAIRVRFVSGKRALTYFNNCIEREAQMSSKLSAPSVEHLALVDKLLKEKRDTTKRYDIYADELAILWAKSLSPDEKQNNLIVQHRNGADLKFLIKAATVITENYPKSIVLLSGDEGFPVGPGVKPAKIDNRKPISGPFVLFGEIDSVNRVKTQVLEILGGRGGGRPGKLQGQASTLNQLESAKAHIVEHLFSNSDKI